MPKITFFVRSNNNNAKTFSLYCRLVLNRRTSEFSTGEIIDPTYWNQDEQLYQCHIEEQTNYINVLCTKIAYKLKTIVLLIENEKGTVYPEDAIKKLKSPTVDKAYNIFEVIEKFISWEKLEGDLKEVTINIHERHLRHLRDFAGKKQYYVPDFNEVEAERFKDWFRESRGTKKKTSASRQISFYKNALDWGVKKGIIKSHNLLFYKGERDKRKPPVSLSADELLALIKYQFKSKMLTNIKELFLFQAATGISYGDLWSNFLIRETVEGKIIEGKRNKGNGNPFFIPYDPMAEAILIKHNNSLPKYCNGTYNRLLKEIAALVGIEKNLHTHIGRKTFATLKLANGWNLYNVSLMLGHSSIQTTEKYYIEKSAESIIIEMGQRNIQASA